MEIGGRENWRRTGAIVFRQVVLKTGHTVQELTVSSMRKRRRGWMTLLLLLFTAAVSLWD